MATLEEIARRAGVSRNTVARALSGQTKAEWKGTATRVRRIRELAASLGYRPNTAAKATATGQFGAVAFVQRSNANFLPHELLRGISDELAANDLRMTFTRLSQESVADETFAPRLLREFCVDGILVNEALNIPTTVSEMIRRHRIPAVWINAKDPYDSVYPDEILGVSNATAMLISMGHRRIHYIDYFVEWTAAGTDHYSHFDRQEGYKQAMGAAGLVPQVLQHAYPAKPWGTGLPWGSELDDRLERIQTLLRRADRPTAMILDSLPTAAVVVEAAARLLLRIPADLSLITLSQDPIQLFSVQLSTLVLPMHDVGTGSVRLLLRKMHGKAARVGSTAISYPPPTPGSIAPPP